MHVSCNKWSPHYDSSIQYNYLCFVNGMDVTDECFEAKEGWIFGFAKCNKLDDGGKAYIDDNGELATEKLWGNVRLIPK